MARKQPVITVDRAATRSRIGKLRRYVAKNLLADANFLCSHQADCRNSCRLGDVFREGTMSHTGDTSTSPSMASPFASSS
jgi:hypothetical protein